MQHYFTLLLLLATHGFSAELERPNFLCLVSEDNNPFLGCYGDPLSHTPTLDRLAKDMDGLMMADWCISGNFIAPARYRVTGNAVAMGEAAGAVAALAARTKRAPHDVPWSEALPVIAKTHAKS